MQLYSIEELSKRLQLVRDKKPFLKQTRTYFVEPVLETMGFPVSDIFGKMEVDYNLTSGHSINYVYKDDEGNPIIAIDAKRINEDTLIQSNENKDIFVSVQSIRYLLTTNGQTSTLYNLSESGRYRYLLEVDLISDYDKLRERLDPENIIQQKGDYWEGREQRRIETKITNQKEYYLAEFNKFIADDVGLEREFTPTEMAEILNTLLSKSDETENVKLNTTNNNVKRLSDLSKANNYTNTKIKEIRINNKLYEEVSYREALRLIVQLINEEHPNMTAADIRRYNKNATVKSATSFKQLPKYIKSHESRYTKLGPAYLGLNLNANSIMVAIIELCETFDVDQDKILITY